MTLPSLGRSQSVVHDPPRSDLLQLACNAVGIDRSAFPAILQMVRGLNGGRPGKDANPGRERAA